MLRFRHFALHKNSLINSNFEVLKIRKTKTRYIKADKRMIIASIILLLIAGLLTAILFILAEHKEEVWDEIVRGDRDE